VTITVSVTDQAAASSNTDKAIYCQRDLWYFRADNGDEIGPFRYRSEAVASLERVRQQAAQLV